MLSLASPLKLCSEFVLVNNGQWLTAISSFVSVTYVPSNTVFVCINVRVCMHMYVGINNASISDVIPQEGPMDDELLEYTKLQDENTRVTPAAEQSQHGTLQRSDATMDDDEYSFARAQSVALGVDDVEQDEQKGSNHLLRQREEFKSMDIDIEKRFTSSLHHWDDIANLAELKDEGTFDESKTTDDVPTSGDSVAKKPKHTVPYRESVVSASSLESVILDEHCNLRSAQSSNRSSLVDVEDVLFEFTEPVMSTITEG